MNTDPDSGPVRELARSCARQGFFVDRDRLASRGWAPVHDRDCTRIGLALSDGVQGLALIGHEPLDVDDLPVGDLLAMMELDGGVDPRSSTARDRFRGFLSGCGLVVAGDGDGGRWLVGRASSGAVVARRVDLVAYASVLVLFSTGDAPVEAGVSVQG